VDAVIGSLDGFGGRRRRSAAGVAGGFDGRHQVVGLMPSSKVTFAFSVE